jgi:hypothetical protein
MDKETREKAATLIQLELDGLLSDEQFAELSSLLKSSLPARRYYARAISLISLFRSTGTVYSLPQQSRTESEELFDSAMWEALLQYEKQAAPLQIEKTTQKEEIVTDVRQRKAMLKANRNRIPSSLWVALASVAALLLMMVYVYLKPPLGYEVATVTDCIDLKWSSSRLPEPGTRLIVSPDPIELQRGVLKIESDKGVTVLLEAPATFYFASANEITLTYGRLFATVPAAGSGFTVQTQNSKIIDLGTRFGISAEVGGQTELHMFKGKTLVIAGPASNPKQTTEVMSGRAVRVDYGGGAIKDIPLREEAFVQYIDSRTDLVWRGRKVINLADVVGGGNGFGTGIQRIGINPATGQFRQAQAKTMRNNNAYVPVDSNVFVDGVFVPDGSNQQIVSSARHIFVECPPTSGYYYMDIAYSPAGKVSNDEGIYPLYLNQTNYSAKDNPCIFMHSNTGITFDLQQYRRRLPETKIVRFQTEFGISDSAPAVYIADVWVLIDGQVRYTNAEPMRRGQTVDIDLEITDQDRFLTLMVTDGSVRGLSQDTNAIGSDWGLFGRPFLIMQ